MPPESKWVPIKFTLLTKEVESTRQILLNRRLLAAVGNTEYAEFNLFFDENPKFILNSF